MRERGGRRRRQWRRHGKQGDRPIWETHASERTFRKQTPRGHAGLVKKRKQLAHFRQSGFRHMVHCWHRPWNSSWGLIRSVRQRSRRLAEARREEVLVLLVSLPRTPFGTETRLVSRLSMFMLKPKMSLSSLQVDPLLVSLIHRRGLVCNNSEP